jgi:nucleoside-diphosphate-sugar epimerase
MFDRLSGMKILVTGGAGFVGSNLVFFLVNEGAKVTVLDDFFTGKIENLARSEGKYDLVRGSVTDRELIRDLVSKSEIISSRRPQHHRLYRDPYEDYQTNIAALRISWRLENFIQSV